MKTISTLVALVSGIALAIVVGREMSAEAMAVAIGVVCGVAAGIPTAFLLLVALTRRDQQRAEESGPYTRHSPRTPTSVVIIDGPARQPQAGNWPALPEGTPTHRPFRVITPDDVKGANGRGLPNS